MWPPSFTCFEMKYSWCLGIVLDGNYNEKVCPRRGNCAFYIEDLFRRFSQDQLEDDFLLNEPGKECEYYSPRQIEEPKEEVEIPFMLLSYDSD